MAADSDADDGMRKVAIIEERIYNCVGVDKACGVLDFGCESVQVGPFVRWGLVHT